MKFTTDAWDEVLPSSCFDTLVTIQRKKATISPEKGCYQRKGKKLLSELVSTCFKAVDIEQHKFKVLVVVQRARETFFVSTESRKKNTHRIGALDVEKCFLTGTTTLIK